VLALPYGGGGNTSAYARGFAEAGAGMPRLLSVQSAVRATTVGSAIRIISPVHREQVEAAAEVVTVPDAELLEWWSAIARLEGLFCEPASAAGVAGVAQARPEGRVVCVLTGHGLKDPEAVDRL
jgi:threonine synthase